MYITRDFEDKILDTFKSSREKGLILAGIVGSGKTTIVKHCLEKLKKQKKIFEYTGDDLTFRTRVAQDSKYIFNDVTSQTQEAALVFVDEVQKSEAIFDALKYAFDQGKVSFLVTGSNPEYLNTVARKRLQRRADFTTLLPFSLPEILLHYGYTKESLSRAFSSLLLESEFADLPITHLTLTSEMTELINRYLSSGGLPLALLSPAEESFLEIRKTVERGFEAMFLDGRNISEVILTELARVHSLEFTYTNLFKKTGLRRREQINKVIQQLKGHGYLILKKPYFFNGAHRSYLCIYSYIDPGIVSYLTGDSEIKNNLGPRIEGVVHAQLSSRVQEALLKSELGYFKPYKVEKKGDVKFLPGEIDFIYKTGKRVIPIEVKATRDLQSIDSRLMSDVLAKHRLAFGIILYGGVPFVDKEKKLVFWPWWGV